MKKLLLLLICTLLCTISFADDTVKSYIYEVTTVELNVRDAPSKNSNIIGTCHQGEQIIIAKIEGDWALIKKDDNVNRWVSVKFLKLVSIVDATYDSSIKKGRSVFNVFEFIGLDISIPDFKVLQQFGNTINIGGYVWMIIVAILLVFDIMILWIAEYTTWYDIVHTIIMILVSLYCILYFISVEDPTWFCVPDKVGWAYTIFNFILFTIFVGAWAFCYTIQLYSSAWILKSDSTCHICFYSLIATPVVIKIMSLFSLDAYNFIPISLLGAVYLWQVYTLYKNTFGKNRILKTILHLVIFVITTVASFCIAGVYIPLLIIAIIVIVGISIFSFGGGNTTPTHPSAKSTILDSDGRQIDVTYDGHGVWRDNYGNYYKKSGGYLVRK